MYPMIARLSMAALVTCCTGALVQASCARVLKACLHVSHAKKHHSVYSAHQRVNEVAGALLPSY
jgi:hypothetical protein